MLMSALENKDRRIGLLLFCISFSLFALFMSGSLDDWDSVQFALAIHEFDITKHQPHPPGYPAYIVMAKLMHRITGDDTLTLTLLSALFGGLSITFTYLLGKQLFEWKTALFASALLLFNPTHFLFSIVAMNDVVALSFILMSAVSLIEGKDNGTRLIIGAFLVGFGLGIRPQNTPVFMFIYFLAFFSTDEPRTKILMLASSLAGALIWLTPVVWNHGILDFIGMGHEQFTYHKNMRMNFDLYHLLVSIYFLTWKGLFLYTVLFLALCVVLYKTIARQGMKEALKRLLDKRPPSSAIVFLSTWFVIAMATQLFFFSLYTSRYVLPSLVPMIILLAGATVSFYRDLTPGRIKKAFVGLLVASMAYTGVSTMHRARLLKITTPPPVQAASYIKENFKKDEVGILALASRRHFEYHLSGCRILRGDPDAIERNLKKLSNAPNMKWIISEKKLERMDAHELEFKREKAIYPKHDLARFFVYTLDENRHLKRWDGEKRNTGGASAGAAAD